MQRFFLKFVTTGNCTMNMEEHENAIGRVVENFVKRAGSIRKLGKEEWKKQIESAVNDFRSKDSNRDAIHTKDLKDFLLRLHVVASKEDNRRPVYHMISETYRNESDTAYVDPHTREGSQTSASKRRRSEKPRAGASVTLSNLPRWPDMSVHFGESARNAYEDRTTENLQQCEAVQPHSKIRRSHGIYTVTYKYEVCVKADITIRIYSTGPQRNQAACGAITGTASGAAVGPGLGAAIGAGIGTAVGFPLAGFGALPLAAGGAIVGALVGLVGAPAGGVLGGIGGWFSGRRKARENSSVITAKEVFKTLPDYRYDEANNLVYCTVPGEITDIGSQVEVISL